MKPAKTSIKHPYAATEHRVIDSPAYADLSYAARSLLVAITRQLTKDNNGHLQATFKYMERLGFSVNTLSRATKELIAHGFIYRTKSGGFHQGAAQFAVTWLPITNKQGIYLAGFQPCAWRDWLPTEKKSRPPKVRACSLKNGELTPPSTPIKEAEPPPKSEHNELCHVGGIYSSVSAVTEQQPIKHPANTELVITCNSEYTRESDSDLAGAYWNDEKGEYIKPPIKAKMLSPEIERVLNAIEVFRENRSVA